MKSTTKVHEIFKVIPGFHDYMVSNLGRVMSLKYGKNKILKPSDSSRYRVVSLSVNGKIKYKRVPQLVAIAFLNHTPCGYKVIVDHIDNDQKNDKLSNLQLITIRENTIKDLKDCASDYPGVSFRKDTQKWTANIWINQEKKYLGQYTNEIDAANAYKVALGNL